MNKLKIFVYVTFLTSLAISFSSSAQTTSRPVTGCGEQCVRLLCEYYRNQISEYKIIEFLKPNELGEATFKDLERCIKKVGLDCYAFKGNSKDLTRIQYPVILHFKKTSKHKVGHFLVSLLEPKENKLIGYDPALAGAPFDLTPEKLDKFWTGAGLVVFPKKLHQKPWLLFVLTGGGICLGSFIALIRS